MEDVFIMARYDDAATLSPNDDPKLDINDEYSCTTCPYPVEILKIDDKENTVTFKCLNSTEKQFK